MTILKLTMLFEENTFRRIWKRVLVLFRILFGFWMTAGFRQGNFRTWRQTDKITFSTKTPKLIITNRRIHAKQGIFPRCVVVRKEISKPFFDIINIDFQWMLNRNFSIDLYREIEMVPYSYKYCEHYVDFGSDTLFTKEIFQEHVISRFIPVDNKVQC